MEKEIVSLLGENLPQLITFLVAMLPISELRGAIPLGLSLNLSPLETFFWAILGNLVPIIPLLLFLKPASERLRRFYLFEVFFSWLFTRTREKSKLIERLEVVGLALFVAIPLPLTGAWSGAVAALLFNIPFKYSFPAIVAGVLIAGIVVTLAALGVIQLWNLHLKPA